MNVPDWVDSYTSWYASEHRIIIAGALRYSVPHGHNSVTSLQQQMANHWQKQASQIHLQSECRSIIVTSLTPPNGRRIY